MGTVSALPYWTYQADHSTRERTLWYSYCPETRFLHLSLEMLKGLYTPLADTWQKHYWNLCLLRASSVLFNSSPFASQEEEEDAQGVWGQEPPGERLGGSSEPGYDLLCCSTLNNCYIEVLFICFVEYASIPTWCLHVLFIFLHLPKMQRFHLMFAKGEPQLTAGSGGRVCSASRTFGKG